MDLDVNMGFHVEVEKDGTSVTMEIDLNRDLFYVRGEEDAFQIYTNSSLDLAMLGVSKSSEIEGYVVGDKDKITQYQKGEDDEEWVKSEKDAKDGVSYAFDFTNIAEQLTLAEETVTERDTECYVLEGNVKCGDIDFLFDDLAMDESEMEDVEATLTIKVAKKEQLPLSISLAIDEDECPALRASLTSRAVCAANVSLLVLLSAVLKSALLSISSNLVIISSGGNLYATAQRGTFAVKPNSSCTDKEFTLRTTPSIS